MSKPDWLKPLTKKELREYFEPYSSAFLGWTLEGGAILARSVWPLKQAIGIEPMSDGSYRPFNTVRTVAGPTGIVLDQHLDVRNRQISRRQHERMAPQVLRAIYEQFLPDPKTPLNLETALRLVEPTAADSSNPHYSWAAAVLSAHLGDTAAATRWCEMALSRSIVDGRSPWDWEVPILKACRGLRAAISRGEASEFIAQFRSEP